MKRSLLFLLVLAISSPLVSPTPAVGDEAPCQVQNVTQATPAVESLQAVIDASHPGDTIQIEGTCVGGFKIPHDLDLVGVASLERATLDGIDTRRVLIVQLEAHLTLTDLLLTRGLGDLGGGILNRGTLRLEGSTEVSGNRSTSGGGGISNAGTLVLADDSVVSGNVAGGWGAGIRNHGEFTMDASSSVRGNEGQAGGGIFSSGTVVLNDSASVSENRAESGGGIISWLGHETVVMNDESSVTRNVAIGSGGGIYHFGQGQITLNDAAMIAWNEAETQAASTSRTGATTGASDAERLVIRPREHGRCLRRRHREQLDPHAERRVFGA